MTRALSLAAALLSLAGCQPKDEAIADDTSGDDTDVLPASGESQALLVTVSADYSVGALATIGLDDWKVKDELTATSGDPALAVDGAKVFQINRFNYDTIRVYNVGVWDAPELEFSVGDLSNPYDADLCGGKLFVSRFGAGDVAIYDPTTGTLQGTVDLSTYADADGSAEPGGLQEFDGKLYAALARLDRDGDWSSVGGEVVAIDCASGQVSDHWSTTGEPSLHAWTDDKLLVNDRGAGLRVLSGGSLSEPLIDSVALGLHFGGVAAQGEHAVLSGTDSDYNYSLWCADLSAGTASPLASLTSAVWDVEGNDRGEAWIAARPHWAYADSAGGTLVYDIESCTAKNADTWLETSLAPYAIAFY